jgi:hypothetical protein
MGKRTAGAAGAQDLTDAFKRVEGFEAYLVFAIEPLESSPSGWPIQRTYHLSEGRFPWLHVCYPNEDQRTFKLWEYACKPREFIDGSVDQQPAAGWLVEIVKRIERCEIQNCRQSAIDPDDIYKLITHQRPEFSKMVGYSIPNLTEAAIELVEIAKNSCPPSKSRVFVSESELDLETIEFIRTEFSKNKDLKQMGDKTGLTLKVLLSSAPIVEFLRSAAKSQTQQDVANALKIDRSEISRAAASEEIIFGHRGRNFRKSPT